MQTRPNITFGIIVLNGEPFTRYNLRSLYPYAHQIIIVEGACPAASGVATSDGHSTDETLEVIRRFQAEEDTDRKVVLVTAEDEGHPDGFWREKDEMSAAYANRATGNYLWQVDCDEFYHEEHMARILEMLAGGVDAVTFPTLFFWGALNYVSTGYYFVTDRYREFHRLFAWGAGYQYLTHRPPTVIDGNGIDTRSKRHLDAARLEQGGIYMFHYSLLFPKQVQEKVSYYARVPWTTEFRNAEAWAGQSFFSLRRPFRVFTCYARVSWLERYSGPHPKQVLLMMEAVKAGVHPGISLREVADIEQLLCDPWFRFRRAMLRIWIPGDRVTQLCRKWLVFRLKKIGMLTIAKKIYFYYRKA